MWASRGPQPATGRRRRPAYPPTLAAKPPQALGGLGTASPYRRFLLGLTGVTLAGVLALAGALSLLLHRYPVDSTAKVTHEAGILHLRPTAPLPPSCTPQTPTGEA